MKPDKLELGQLWKFDFYISFSYIAKVLSFDASYVDLEVVKIIKDPESKRPVGYKIFNLNVKDLLTGIGWDFVGNETQKAPLIQYGSTCQKCKEYNQYVETSPNFMCYGCRN